MLDAEGSGKRKHTFADDMESLLYIVQYSALLWQPHAFDKENLTYVVSTLFDWSTFLLGFGLHGGTPKKQNLLRRILTADVNFGSKALEEWLEFMMTFCSPFEDTPEQYKNMWSNPASIDAFWEEFLRTHTLEPDNRVEHTLDTAAHLNSL